MCRWTGCATWWQVRAKPRARKTRGSVWIVLVSNNYYVTTTPSATTVLCVPLNLSCAAMSCRTMPRFGQMYPAGSAGYGMWFTQRGREVRDRGDAVRRPGWSQAHSPGSGRGADRACAATRLRPRHRRISATPIASKAPRRPKDDTRGAVASGEANPIKRQSPYGHILP